eukprot:jgi/Ulvmu1/7217/UM035_0003.1
MHRMPVLPWPEVLALKADPGMPLFDYHCADADTLRTWRYAEEATYSPVMLLSRKPLQVNPPGSAALASGSAALKKPQKGGSRNAAAGGADGDSPSSEGAGGASCQTQTPHAVSAPAVPAVPAAAMACAAGEQVGTDSDRGQECGEGPVGGDGNGCSTAAPASMQESLIQDSDQAHDAGEDGQADDREHGREDGEADDGTVDREDGEADGEADGQADGRDECDGSDICSEVSDLDITRQGELTAPKRRRLARIKAGPMYRWEPYRSRAEIQRELPDDFEHLVLDGEHVGNVSRFFNHACNDASNVVFQHVLLPGAGSALLYCCAFFTEADVLAMTELRWDYNEYAGEGGEAPEGSMPCLCGSRTCRTWLH